jgi:hypothetical protein
LWLKSDLNVANVELPAVSQALKGTADVKSESDIIAVNIVANLNMLSVELWLINVNLCHAVSAN